jgi:hypothetical protein
MIDRCPHCGGQLPTDRPARLSDVLDPADVAALHRADAEAVERAARRRAARLRRRRQVRRTRGDAP